MFAFALSAFTTLIVILDPVGLVPIFLSLTTGMSDAARRQTAVVACTLAAMILSGVALFGAALLSQLGISLSAFRIAGGLLLFYTAFEMVFEKRATRRQIAVSVNGKPAEFLARMTDADVRRVAAFPLAVPLLAGPGAITVVILLAAKAGDQFQLQAWLHAMIAASCAACLTIFIAAGPVDRLLGETAKIVLTRLLGVLLAALAIQFVADGIVEIVRAA